MRKRSGWGGKTSTIDLLAEMLAEDVPLTECARKLNISYNHACQLLWRMKKRLGPQAV